MPRPFIHVLSNIDETAKRADCAICGRVRIRWRSRKGAPPKWICRGPRQPSRGSQASRDGTQLRRRGASITLEQVQEIRARGVCEVCGATSAGARRLHIDHDHETGQVRGLLCHSCNLALGHVSDDPERLRALVKYLAKYRREPRSR